VALPLLECLCRHTKQACDETVEGNLHDAFCVDMLQGGAGATTMQNANEVIANRAL